MEDKILADTAILIGLQRGDEQVVKKFDQLKNRVVVSRITVCELIFGSRDQQEKRINQEFLSYLDILEIDERVSVLCYELMDKYGLKMRLGIADALIAATAVVHGLLLWTENIKHFQMIKEVKLFKPKEVK